jgi:hypothetical protein
MHFLIVTQVVHKCKGDLIFGYGPYIKEMNIWLKYVDKVTVVAPFDPLVNPDPIDLSYTHPHIHFVSVPEFNLLTWKSFIG